MKIILKAILLLISFNCFSQLDLNGELVISSSYYWKFKYKKTTDQNYTEATYPFGVNYFTPSTQRIKINPFLAYDYSKQEQSSPYNFNDLQWSNNTINQDYVSITPKNTGYTFGFDTSPINEGWRGYKLSNFTTSNTLKIENYVINSSNKAISIQFYNPCNFMFVSPKLNNLDSNKKITFKAAKSSIFSYGQIQIGTLTDPYDPSTFQLLSTPALTTSFNTFEVFLNNYTGQGQYIAFKTIGSSSNTNIIIDDFTYEDTINCTDITNLNISNITQNTLNYSFDANPNQNLWEIELKNVSKNTFEYFTINSTNGILNNLIGNTNYQLKIRAKCINNNRSNWSNVINFTTICTSINPGYFTSFLDINYVDPCWTSINNTGSVTQVSEFTSTIQGQNFILQPKSGSKFIKIYAANNSNTYFISPFINNINQNNRIKFFLFRSNTYSNSTITIGTMSNPNDPSTFVPLNTITADKLNEPSNHLVNDYWKEHIVYLDNLNNNLNHHYIAFRADIIAGYNSANYYLDDFTFENSPICKEPTNLFQSNITHNSALIKWEVNDNNENLWEIQFGPSGFQIGNGIIVSANSNPFLLENLNPETNYDFYVRTKCGNVYSNWSDRGTFKTKCLGVYAGFTDNFESGSFNQKTTCWYRNVNSFRLYTYPFQINYYNALNASPSQNHPINNNSITIRYNAIENLYNNIDNLILITPKLIDFDNSKKIKFKLIKEYTENLNYLEIGTLSDPNNPNTFNSFKKIYNVPLNTWTDYEIDFSSYVGNDKYLGFRLKNNSPNNDVHVSIDDFQYLENECLKPNNLFAFQNNPNSAYLTWNPIIQNSQNFEIECIETETNTSTFFISNLNNLSINNLIADKTYKFRVRNICSNNTINWSDFYNFRISGSRNTNYVENFDSYNTDEIFLISQAQNLSWYNLPVYENPNNPTYQPNTNTNFVKWNLNYENISSPNYINLINSTTNKTACLVSPFLNDLNSTKIIKFKLPFYNGKLKFGIIKNPCDISTFTLIEERDYFNYPTIYNDIIINLSNYNINQGKFFAILLDRQINNTYTDSFVAIDDFNYYDLPNCIEPSSIFISNVNNNSAQINWNNNSNIETTIEYGISGFTLGNGTIFTSNNNSTLITNLINNSNYDVYLKYNCNNTTSSIQGPYKFTTQCNPLNIPWIEKFNNQPQYGSNLLPNCFNVLTSGITSFNNNLNSYLNGYDDNFFLATDFLMNIALPPIYLYNGVSYKFKLKAKKSYEFSFSDFSISINKDNLISTYSNSITLPKIGQLTEYNYSDFSVNYTPIENNSYNFRIFRRNTALNSNDIIMDNFEITEAYPGTINSTFNYNFSSLANTDLVLENTSYSNCILNNNDNILFNSTNNINANFNITENNIWKQNEISIPKLNFKIDPTNMQHPIVLKFDLKQNYDVNRDHSLFRVIINGNQIGETLKPNTPNNDEYETKQFDLTSYASSPIYVSLQHLGNYNTNNLNNAYLDNLRIENFLSSESILNSEFQIFPNPTKDIITIKNNSKIDIYQLYSIDGKLIEENKIEENEFNVDLSKYNSGIYLLKLISENKTYTEKIIKQ